MDHSKVEGTTCLCWIQHPEGILLGSVEDTSPLRGTRGSEQHQESTQSGQSQFSQLTGGGPGGTLTAGKSAEDPGEVQPEDPQELSWLKHNRPRRQNESDKKLGTGGPSK